MTSLQTTFAWFNTLPTARKLNLGLSFLGIFIISGLLAWFTLSPTYAVLFNRLDDEDASRLVGQLEEEHIPYRLQNGGHEILIEKSIVEKTRLKLMTTNLKLHSSLGFELFDKSDFGMTDFSQKINYQRALQGELERTIKSLDEIAQARVHLVIPESRLFDQQNNQPKAAVTVHLKNKISTNQVRSIQQLIAASVAHLELKNVIVVDQNGKTLSGHEEDVQSNHLGTKKAIEQYLSNKAMALLEPIFRHQQVMVKIDAAINYDELQRELIKPQSQGLITHEKESKHATVGKHEKEKENQDITVEKSYQLGQEKELFKRASGSVEKLTISVVLPQNSSKNTIAQVQLLVKSAVGFDPKRGDNINVVALINEPVKSAAPKAPIIHNTLPNPRIDYSIPLFILSAFILGLIFLMKKIRARKRQLLLMELTQWLAHHD